MQEEKYKQLSQEAWPYNFGVQSTPKHVSTREQSLQALKAYGNQKKMTQPSALNLKVLQKMIHELITIALPRSIFNALTVAYSDNKLNRK